MGSFSNQSAIVDFKGIELAFAPPLRRPLCRRLQILLDGVPAHAQVPFDLADRPALGPVQAVQVVDLIGREHGASSVIRQKPPGYQHVVVCKIPKPGACAAEVLPESRLAPELSCCLQDSGGRRPGARSLLRNALGRKLSCCLQDRAGAVFGPERAAVGGCARPRLGVAHGTAASNRGCGTAISEGCPGIPGGIPGLPRFSGGDNRRDAAAGTQVRCIPTALVDISMAGRIVHSSGIAVRPYRRLSHLSDATFTLGDLETAVEWVPHPGRWLVFFDYKPAELVVAHHQAVL